MTAGSGQLGRQPFFEDKENEVLRAELRALKDRLGVTGAQLARLLGVKQQTVSKLVGYDRAGMSRQTADALAKYLNFKHATHLLEERGVFSILKEPPSGQQWATRDMAVRVAQHLQYDPAAIDAVIARFTSKSDRTRPMKWWLGNFWVEEMRIKADRDDEQRAEERRSPGREREQAQPHKAK